VWGKYDDSIKARFTARHRRCLELCGDFKGRKVLNIGCYNGWLEKAAVEGGAESVVGIDVESRFVGMAQKNVSQARFLKESVFDLSFPPSSFDLVTMFDVLEHLPRGKEGDALRIVARILKHRGVFVVSTPNDHILSKIFDPAWYFGHRHYSSRVLRGLFEEAGFKVEFVGYGGGLIELVSMILLYIFKCFGREVPLKAFIEKLRWWEYDKRLRSPKFATLYCKGIC